MSREACIELARTLGIPEDVVVEQWAERAAIREFEGGQSRADAERDALDDVRATHRRGPRSASVAADADAKKRAT
jgi:hypothetical protein